jgi:pantoate--beta-alanine ligase
MTAAFTALAAWREERRAQRQAGLTLGFVPTMGALHEGHLSLVSRSRADNDATLVSIFVNPTQFDDRADYEKYPRTLEDDVRMLEAAGADYILLPSHADLYPDGFRYRVVEVDRSRTLEGAHRPGHFDAVLTVVLKLLQLASAERAYFGEKDWQQLQVITRLVRDLDLPVKVVSVPTVREEDGLALSSRNRYLNEEGRKRAVLINKILKETTAAIHDRPEAIEAALTAARKQLIDAGFRVDYFECADAATCAPVRKLEKPARLLTAVWLGNTRLIDNWPIEK